MTFNNTELETILQALRTYYGYLLDGEANAVMDDAREIFADKADKTRDLIIAIEAERKSGAMIQV